MTSGGARTRLYVIEIEVMRDWKLCKEIVYYTKCWTEKRGVKIDKDPSAKKSLTDFFKVHKEEFDDVAIRTNGASTSVKKHEVNRQVREPLLAKYKEWKREAKLGECELAQKATVPLRCGRITNSSRRNYFLKLKSSNVRFVAIVTCKKMH